MRISPELGAVPTPRLVFDGVELSPLRPAQRVLYASAPASTSSHSQPGTDTKDANDEWDVFFDTMQVPHKKDAEVTLGDVWAWKSRKNLAKGDCDNPDIAIKFENDLGCEF